MLLVLVAAAHGLAWRWATGALAVGASDWVTQRRAEGWAIDHGVPTRGGWPFAATLTLADLRIGSPAALDSGGLAYEAAGVVLELAPRTADRLVIRPTGAQRLRLSGTDAHFVARRMELALPLAHGPGTAELTVAELEARLPEGSMLLQSGRVAVAPAAMPPGSEPALRIAVAAAGLLPPPSRLSAALGPRVEAISVEAVLTRVPPPAGRPAMLAAAWRDAGGALDVSAATLRWGPLAGEAQGTIGLDAALQPQGRGLLRIAGAPQALQALAAAGLVEPGTARAAQGVLAFMARPAAGDGPPQVELPVSVTRGVVALAQIPMARMPPLAW